MITSKFFIRIRGGYAMIKIFKNAIFIALILFFSVSAPSAAQEIGGKVYTIKEGETLLDIAKTDEVMVLAIKILNDLENPLELKTGSKIIIPDGSFVNEIIAMSATELEDRAEEYQTRVSSTLMAELNASYVDPQIQKNMGNLAELPKPIDANPGFFQGVMPSFKPMYGFFGAAFDQALAALEESWKSSQSTFSSFFKTSLGIMPKSSRRDTAATVALSASNKWAASAKTTARKKTSSSNSNASLSSLRAGTSGHTSSTTTGSTTSLASNKPSYVLLGGGLASGTSTTKPGSTATSGSATRPGSTATSSGTSTTRPGSSIFGSSSAALEQISETASPGAFAGATASGGVGAAVSGSVSSSDSSTNLGTYIGAVTGATFGMMTGGIAGAAAGAAAGATAGSTLGSGGSIAEAVSAVKDVAQNALSSVKNFFQK